MLAKRIICLFVRHDWEVHAGSYEGHVYNFVLCRRCGKEYHKA